MIRWNCIACQEMLEAPESLSGGALQCPQCGAGNAVPARWLAHVARRWFLISVAAGMLLAGLWFGSKMNRTTVVVNPSTEPNIASAWLPDAAAWDGPIFEQGRETYQHREERWLTIWREEHPTDTGWLYSAAALFPAEVGDESGLRCAMAIAITSQLAGLQFADVAPIMSTKTAPVGNSSHVATATLAGREVVLVVHPGRFIQITVSGP